jgi:hypothetical protein
MSGREAANYLNLVYCKQITEKYETFAPPRDVLFEADPGDFPMSVWMLRTFAVDACYVRVLNLCYSLSLRSILLFLRSDWVAFATFPNVYTGLPKAPTTVMGCDRTWNVKFQP